jgi:acetyl-CoA carboxylase biotin carboxyl carrier protein
MMLAAPNAIGEGAIMSGNLLQDVQGLLAAFEAGGWQKLHLEYEGFSLILSHDSSDAPAQVALGVPVVSSSVPAPVAQTVAASAPQVAAAAPALAATGTQGVDPAWVAVVAPNLGTFYRSPKPGAAPFVEIGEKVSADTEVCLIEVMKLFTSVKAGVAGTLRQVAASDAELVEGGQVLLYIERD